MALGIDLGTTYSCVAHLDDYGKPVVVRNHDGRRTTPSVVYFEDPQHVVVGNQAKNELARRPDHVVSEIKRHMGKEGYFRTIDGRDYSPAQISSFILQDVVDAALEYLGVEPPADGTIADAVITVPAYFGGAEREATKEAAERAGLNVISIINEPTAAAIAYGMNTQDKDQTVLVYDLGGGTFDVTVVRITKDGIRVVAVGGDQQLGGVDWDRRLVHLFLNRFRELKPGSGDPADDQEAVAELELKAEAAKQALTKRSTYEIAFVANRERVQFALTREDFEQLTDDLVQRTLYHTDQILDAATKKGVGHIDEVILVGGMSKMPMIAEALAERLRERHPDLRTPLLQDPDEAVARGAALYASAQSIDEPLLDGGPLPGSVPDLVQAVTQVAEMAGSGLVGAYAVSRRDRLVQLLRSWRRRRDFGRPDTVRRDARRKLNDMYDGVLPADLEPVSERVTPNGWRVVFEHGRYAYTAWATRGDKGIGMQRDLRS